MKKLLIASLFLAFVSSCKDDPKVTTDPLSTASINLLPKQNALLFTGYQLKPTMNGNTQVAVNSALIRDVLEGEYQDRLNHISFTDNSSLLYNSMSDSILAFFATPHSFPYMAIDPSIVYSPPMPTIASDIELAIAKKPLASVGHVVSRDDSSWVVSCKVKFFEDTLVQPNAILIETYMLADVKARTFGAQNLDLRFPPMKDLINTTDSASFWDLDVPNIDTTRLYIKKGDPIDHKYIFVANSNPKNAYGTPVSSYWPFSGDFHEGDIIGTDDTKIHHHFTKLEKDEFNYDRKVRFVTVVWALNPMTNVYDYVNSYSSNTTYKD